MRVMGLVNVMRIVSLPKAGHVESQRKQNRYNYYGPSFHAISPLLISANSF